MAVQLRKVHLPNGSVLEFDNGTSVEDLRALITASGVANLAGAPAVVDSADGSVRFGEPAGGGKA